ncbi:alpha/beta hydrolase [Rhodococcus triatomae]|nr:alpha/beta hydrolase [Rhodococcus triatomae]QNG25656.1 alpha/beta hydrolase [Rhodococcus triatomae]
MVAGAYVIDEGSGTPVVLCGGLGGNWFDWNVAAAALLRRGLRVVRIERPGYGLSPPPGHDPDLATEVDRMSRVLDALEITAPAVVVGHSLGAVYVEGFARIHPDRTRGVPLLDATDTTHPHRILPTRPYVAAAHRVGRGLGGSAVQRSLAPAARRLLNPSTPPGGLPAETSAWIRTVYRDATYLETSLVENAAYPALARDLADLRPARPLTTSTVVAAAHTGHRTPWAAVWMWRQRRFARFLGAAFTVVTPARHHAMIDRPDRVAALIAGLAS